MAEHGTQDTSQSSDRITAAREVVQRINLRPGPAHTCPYLKSEKSRDAAFTAQHLPAGLYHSLMDLNFRRSGRMIYRPACDTCSQCTAIRVPTALFLPDRSQRRCWARNAGINAGLSPLRPTDEKHRLYRRYLRQRHDGGMDESWEAFRDFLYTSPVDTLEVVYRQAGRLVGVGILDFDGHAASTVYCYFDPDHPGALGTFNILWTIEYCRRIGIPWVYLGYFIRDSARMNYKARFRPHETLAADGTWVACS